MNKGFFRGLFDLNHDGKLDPIERAMDAYAYDQLMNDSKDEKDSEDKDSDNDSDW